MDRCRSGFVLKFDVRMWADTVSDIPCTTSFETRLGAVFTSALCFQTQNVQQPHLGIWMEQIHLGVVQGSSIGGELMFEL